MDCYIWYSEEGIGRGRNPPRPLLAIPNTAHPSTASVPTSNYSMRHCNSRCPLKGLIALRHAYVIARQLCCLCSCCSLQTDKLCLFFDRSVMTCSSHQPSVHSSIALFSSVSSSRPHVENSRQCVFVFLQDARSLHVVTVNSYHYVMLSRL